MARIGNPTSIRYVIESSRAASLPNTISPLDRSVANRYSIVRRSRSMAIVPAASAGPSSRTVSNWIHAKKKKKVVARAATAWMLDIEPNMNSSLQIAHITSNTMLA